MQSPLAPMKCLDHFNKCQEVDERKSLQRLPWVCSSPALLLVKWVPMSSFFLPNTINVSLAWSPYSASTTTKLKTHFPFSWSVLPFKYSYSFSTQLMVSNISQKGSCWIQISKTFLAKGCIPLYSHLPLLSCIKSLLKLLHKQIWGMRGKATRNKNWWLFLATLFLELAEILPHMKLPSPIADFLSNL